MRIFEGFLSNPEFLEAVGERHFLAAIQASDSAQSHTKATA
jgi:hypothetical protein